MAIKSRAMAETIKKYWAVGFVVFSATLLGCQQEINVPQQLKGVWKNPYPKYKDCYIEFTGNALIFGLGHDEKTVNTIKKIKFAGDYYARLYTIYFVDSEGEKWTIALTYHPFYRNGVFQLQNSKELWTRYL